MRNLALWYSQSWNVVPVEGKKPIYPNWQNTKSNNSQINKWFATHKNINIGAITGASSGIVVIDIDSDEGLQEIERYLPEKTPTVITGSGGRHFYFKHPGEPVPNSVKILPGVDVRGENGMVVLPPSVHPNGNEYYWANEWVDPDNLPGLPPHILNLVTKTTNKRLTSEDWNKTIGQGERDAELTRRAGKLVRAKIPANEIISMLHSWNTEHCDPPLPKSQIQKIVNSIVKRQPEKDKTKREPFKVLSFEDTLKNYGLQETIWLIKDWVPESTCGLVVAPPANYKTWLLLDLAISVASGKPFLNQFVVENPGPVLFIQQEDPFPLLFNRIGTILNIGEPKSFNGEFWLPKAPSFPSIYWHTERMLNFSDENSLIGLQEAIAKIRPRLVIIDPLYSAISSKDYMAEGAQSMLVLKNLRDQYKCSFMIAHHTVKRGDLSGRESLWGSQFLNAWLETGWQIRPSKDGENVVSIKRHFKNSEVPSTLKIKFDINEWHFRVSTNETDTLIDVPSVELIDQNKTSDSTITNLLGRSKYKK